LLKQNINPAQVRVAKKCACSPETYFKAVALGWHKSNKAWSENHAARLLACMSNHIFPLIGHLPVTELKTRHFTALLKGIEEKGLPELLARIDGYMAGRTLTRLAVTLTLHLFIRSSELRFARWREINFRNGIWTLPSTHDTIAGVRYSGRGAKMRTPHIVPLSRQAVATLRQIQKISGHLELVFPGDHNSYKPMCENTVNKALRLMAYDTKTDVCGHGFRAMD